MRILLIEDDELLGDGIVAGLRLAGERVEWCHTGRQGDAALAANEFDAVILDRGLPDGDGLERLVAWRRAGKETPVLVLTARGEVRDRIWGLDRGADDYLSKPFDLDELLARIRALHRRRLGHAEPVLRHGEVALDPAARRVSLGNRDVALTPREFDVLRVLLERVGRVVSRAQIEDVLYEWGGEIESNAVEVYVHYLRRKLGRDLIRTERGLGYVIDSAHA
ncbi:MAG: winged helix-turn-helix domain-containing protein [Chromatiales bacterium]|nr:winged helix-turn-helix domain-containing protein [Chromatiales bacterium]